MRFVLALMAVFGAFCGASVQAHESRPLYIDIAATAEGAYSVRWVTPASISPSNRPRISLGDACVQSGGPLQQGPQTSGQFACPPTAGAPRVTIDWPLFNPSISTVVRFQNSGGGASTLMFDPSRNSLELPVSESSSGVPLAYFRLGVSHILAGVDHLLFLAGLLFIAGSPRRTLLTVTGFTVAHSLTLGLVALGMLSVPVPATEAVIALSIVFLATEIARNDRTTIAWRRPILVAALFGLAHGAGFAAALDEIGLPAGEELVALLFFNLGVEAGQIVLVVGVFAALAAAKLIGMDPGRWRERAIVRLPASYIVGSIAAFWLFERLAGAGAFG